MADKCMAPDTMTGNQIHTEKIGYIHSRLGIWSRKYVLCCVMNYTELYELQIIIVDKLHSAAVTVVG